MRAALLLSLSSALIFAMPLRAAELTPEALAGFEHYVRRTEERIERELSSRDRFLVLEFLPEEVLRESAKRLAAGEVFARKLGTVDADGAEIAIPGALVHHWVGAVLVPGARVEDVVRWLQRYDEHERYFDEVERSRLLAAHGDEFDIFLRLRRKKIVTVCYDTEHHVRYRYIGPGRVSSESHSTRIAELENPGTPEEREKPAGDDRGFLWRLDSYWRFEQTAGGVIVECESVSLSRGIPSALRFFVGRYLDSVPRESLESTLLPIRAAVSAIASSAGGRATQKSGR
jgi:hypothetical protein